MIFLAFGEHIYIWTIARVVAWAPHNEVAPGVPMINFGEVYGAGQVQVDGCVGGRE